jgi:hypothetical protein
MDPAGSSSADARDGSIAVVEKLEHILTKLHATSQQAGSLTLQHILVQQSAADALQVRHPSSPQAQHAAPETWP